MFIPCCIKEVIPMIILYCIIGYFVVAVPLAIMLCKFLLKPMSESYPVAPMSERKEE